MKTLVLCIDGLGWYNIKSLPLPYIRTLINNSFFTTPSYKNVLERGWPAIYSGCNVDVTKAYYYAPKFINNKYKITNKTGLSNLQKNPKVSFIWDEINSRGYSTGVFCVPTCTSPVNLDGFFLSATGAGRINALISKEDIKPVHLFDDFPSLKGDLGARMGYGAYIPSSNKELKDFLLNHVESTFDALSYLLDKKKVDVLLFGIRLINEISYKFIGLFDARFSNDLTPFQQEIKNVLSEVLFAFENKLQKLIKEIDPSSIIIVSDHGIKNLEFEVNINELLVKANLIKRKTTLKSFLRPYYHKLKGKFDNKVYPKIRIPQYDFNLSKAFSVGFTDAIYLNKLLNIEENNIFNQIKSIILNNEYCNYMDLTKYEPLEKYSFDGFIDPNFRILLKDGLTNTARYTQILKKNDNLLPGSQIWKEGFWGENSGCKTSDGIFACHTKKNISYPKNLNLFDIKNIILSSVI